MPLVIIQIQGIAAIYIFGVLNYSLQNFTTMQQSLTNYETLYLPSVNSFIAVHNTNPEIDVLIYACLNDGSIDTTSGKAFTNSNFSTEWFNKLTDEDCQLIWNTFKIEVNVTGICEEEDYN